VWQWHSRWRRARWDWAGGAPRGRKCVGEWEEECVVCRQHRSGSERCEAGRQAVAEAAGAREVPVGGGARAGMDSLLSARD